MTIHCSLLTVFCSLLTVRRLPKAIDKIYNEIDFF